MVARAQQRPAAAAQVSFKERARLLSIPLTSTAYDGGTRSPVALWTRADGYFSRFTFSASYSGTYGTTGPTGTDAFAAWAGPIDRIELRNTAVTDLYNLTGEFAAIMTFLDRWYRQPGIPFSSLSAFTAAPGTAAFADTWQFDMPLGVDLVDYPAPVGLYPAGFLGPGPVINIYFRPGLGTAANPGSGIYIGGVPSPATGQAGTVDSQQTYFAPITDQSAQPPADLVHRFREGSIPINGNQLYELQLLQGAYIGRIAWMVIANGALATIANISRVQFEYGGGTFQRDYNGTQFGLYMASTWGAQLPAGVFVLDFYTATHSVRDWFNTAAVTIPRLLLTTTGLTFGGSQNQIRYAVEEFLPYGIAAGMMRR